MKTFHPTLLDTTLCLALLAIPSRRAFGDDLNRGPVQVSASALARDEALDVNQRSVLAWTDRQFRGFFDARTFAGWSADERVQLIRRSLDTLKGPISREYYQAINTLGALGASEALPALRELAFTRQDKNNRDRWMAVRVLGLMDDRESIPDLIHLVYHGNPNTRWWAQISLVRLTDRNFGGDWEAWGRWWNDAKGTPPWNPEIIRWWNGQPANGQLKPWLAENDQKFLEGLRPPATKPPK